MPVDTYQTPCVRLLVTSVNGQGKTGWIGFAATWVSG
jgi:hypothetical protein